jgi:hypothetical protein
MTTLFAFIFLSLLVTGYFLIAGHLYGRRPKKMADLVLKLDTSMVGRLFPFVDPIDPLVLDSKWYGEAVWAALGGARGLLRLRKGCSVAISMARLLEDQQGFAAEAAEFRSLAWSLNWEILGALLENLKCQLHPAERRIQGRNCAVLYCEIAATLEVVLSICEPTVPIAF